MSRVLVTGAAGFIGSHLVDWFLASGHEVIGLDSLTYAGELRRVHGRFVWCDISRPIFGKILAADIGSVDVIVHNCAETHVDHSFGNPKRFIDSNITGTLNVLEACRTLKPSKFIFTSTDEVFGSRIAPAYPNDALAPSNPYAASKAAGEYLVRAYWRAFDVPAVITRSPNIFGVGQHPEKFIPLVIDRVMAGKPVMIHTDGHYGYGSRRWLHISKQCEAIGWLAENGEPGKTYHVAEGTPLDNNQVIEKIFSILGRSVPRVYAAADRKVYDQSYWTSPGKDDPRWEDDRFEDHFAETVREITQDFKS